MKNMITFLSTITILLCFLLSGCSGVQEKREDAVVIKIMVCPSGTFQDSYLFTIKKNGVMRSQFGERKKDNIQSTKSLAKISEEEEVIISDEELEEIISLAKRLHASGYSNEEKVDKEDSWDMIVYYDKVMYEADYWVHNSDVFRKLVDKIIGLSPISVDLHGWS